MKTFRSKWINRSVEDEGCYMSKEAKSFVAAFRNMLKRELNPFGVEVIGMKPNHYDFSGFLKKDDKYVYLSYSIPRYGDRINFDKREYAGPVLVRTAENDHDFRGGHNNFCSITECPGRILDLLR